MRQTVVGRRGLEGMVEQVSQVARSDSVIEVMLGDEALVLNVENGMYYGLDGIGARIWELLGSGATLPSVVDILLEEYDVDRAQLSQDVEQYVADLLARGLLRRMSE